jgi:hypothetical protein
VGSAAALGAAVSSTTAGGPAGTGAAVSSTGPGDQPPLRRSAPGASVHDTGASLRADGSPRHSDASGDATDVVALVLGLVLVLGLGLVGPALGAARRRRVTRTRN